jgi:hypothetical protein
MFEDAHKPPASYVASGNLIDGFRLVDACEPLRIVDASVSDRSGALNAARRQLDQMRMHVEPSQAGSRHNLTRKTVRYGGSRTIQPRSPRNGTSRRCTGRAAW